MNLIGWLDAARPTVGRVVLAGIVLAVSLTVSIDGWSANYFVNGACALNGNGSAGVCATGSGGVGAWNSLSAIAAGGAGDVINVRGGTYSNQTDYYKFPSGVNGAPGNPLIVQNYAARTSSSMALPTFTAVNGHRSGEAFTDAAAAHAQPAEILCSQWQRGTSVRANLQTRCYI
jgi:hypothetical protein